MSPRSLVALGTLKLGDLPAGWIAGISPQDAAQPISSVVECDALRELQSHAVAYGHSAKFFEGAVGDANSYIANSVTVYPNVTFARRAMAQRVGRATRACSKSGSVAHIKSRLPSARVAWEEEQVHAPTVGDSSATVLDKIRVVDPQANVTFYHQYQLVRVGRAVAALDIATEGAQAWTALRVRLARLVAQRMQHGDAVTA